MSIPLRQSVDDRRATCCASGCKRNDKFPLLVELEPLFQCNLACSFCGKIQYPEHILKKRMPVDTALAAIEESGAPMVSIAGGEPLVHPEVHVMARELIKRKKFVYLCTNGILMKKKMDLFEPSPYFAWVVHLDGMRERHDQFVEREGTFDKAVDAIRGGAAARLPRQHEHDVPHHRHAEDGARRARLPERRAEGRPDDDLARVRLREGARPGALPRRARRRAKLFSEAFADGKRKRWRLNHTPLFLDFLEGKVDFQCTPWGIPSYSIFGWQRPCYLMADGYTQTYQELIETTDWSKYGRGNDPRCDNCMAHCGYEPTAVLAATKSLKQTVRAIVAPR